MKRLTLVFLLLTFCATAFAGESQLQKATNVMNEIMSTPDKGIPHDLLDKAVCVGIVPSEVKFALVFGGSLWTRRAGVPQGRERPVGCPLHVHHGRRERGISDWR